MNKQQIITKEQLTIKRSVLRQMRTRQTLLSMERQIMVVIGYVGRNAMESGSVEGAVVQLEDQLFFVNYYAATQYGIQLHELPQIYSI